MALEDFVWDGQGTIDGATQDELLKAMLRHQGFVYAIVRANELIKEYAKDFTKPEDVESLVALNYVMTELKLLLDVKLYRAEVRNKMWEDKG